MKRLDFPAATATVDLYNLAYIGLNNPNLQVTPAELRTHAKLLDKFEAAGTPDAEKGFVLPAGSGATLLLEDAERTLLKKLCDAFPWNVGISRKVVALFDLIDQAPDYLVPVPDPVS